MPDVLLPLFMSYKNLLENHTVWRMQNGRSEGRYMVSVSGGAQRLCNRSAARTERTVLYTESVPPGRGMVPFLK